jgi:NTE family protein
LDAHDDRTPVALVLGGGGARGFAHCGFLQAFDRRPLRAGAVFGCSLGGILGALVAAGLRADDIERFLRGRGVLKSFRFGNRGGLFSTEGLERVIAPYIPKRFEDLEIPLVVTSVDVQTGELVILDEGPLLPALRASSAMPGLLSPVHHFGRDLVDGGLLSNLPVDLARQRCDLPVIAVDVATPADRRIRFMQDVGFFRGLIRRIRGQERTVTADLLLKAFDIPTAALTRACLEEYPPDLLIRPALPHNLKLEDFHRFREAIPIGREAAEKALEGWKPPN